MTDTKLDTRLLRLWLSSQKSRPKAAALDYLLKKARERLGDGDVSDEEFLRAMRNLESEERLHFYVPDDAKPGARPSAIQMLESENSKPIAQHQPREAVPAKLELDEKDRDALSKMSAECRLTFANSKKVK